MDNVTPDTSKATSLIDSANKNLFGRIKEEEAQRSKPYGAAYSVDSTGDVVENKPAERYLLRTQGQQEDMVNESLQGISDQYGKGVADKAIGIGNMKATKEALQSANDKINGISPVAGDTNGLQQWSGVANANRHTDPKAILSDATNILKGTFSNKQFIDNARAEAKRIGMDEQEYIKAAKENTSEQVKKDIYTKLIQSEMPRNHIDYIMKGLSNSIAGLVVGGINKTKGQREVAAIASQMTEQGQNPSFTPNFWDKLGSVSASFVADAPFFGISGELSGQAIKGIAERQLTRLTATGMSKGAAQRVIASKMRSSFGARMADMVGKGAIGGGINLGAYNALHETARQLADQDINPESLAKETAKGIVTGAALGVGGGLTNAATYELSGLPKVLGKVGGFGTEGLIFTTTGRALDGSDKSWVDDLASSYAQLAVMKLTSNPAKTLDNIANFRKAFDHSAGDRGGGLKFTQEEQNEIKQSTGGKGLVESLTGAEAYVSRWRDREAKADAGKEGKGLVTLEKGERLKGEDEMIRKNLSDNYENLMRDKNISYSTKQKVRYLLGGKMDIYVPLASGYTTDSDGKTFTVTTNDKDGNRIERRTFKSEQEANDYTDKLKEAIDKDAKSEKDYSAALAAYNDLIAQDGASEADIKKVIRGETTGDEQKDYAIKSRYTQLFSEYAKQQPRPTRNAEQPQENQGRIEGESVQPTEQPIGAQSKVPQDVEGNNDGLLKEQEAKGSDTEQTTLEETQANSYQNGYDAPDEQKNDVKRAYEKAQTRLASMLPDNIEEIENHPMDFVRDNPKFPTLSEEQKNAVYDYVQAKTSFDGMVHHVQDEMDARVTASDKEVDGRVSQVDGAIHPISLKTIDDNGHDKKAYIINGNVQMLPDGTMVNTEKSDKTIVIRDAVTGETSMIDPREILSMDEPIDAEQEKRTAADAIRQAYSKQEADKIDGVLPFAPGDTYAVVDGQGQPHNVSIVGDAVDEGTGQPIEGAVLATVDGQQAILPKDQIQAMSDAAKDATEVKRDSIPYPFELNDEFVITTTDGRDVRGTITAGADSDGNVQIATEEPVNGQMVSVVSPDELSRSIKEYNGMTATQQEEAQPAEQSVVDSAPIKDISAETSQDIVPQPDNAMQDAEVDPTVVTQQDVAKDELPRDDDGNLVYDKVPVQKTIEDLYDGSLDDNEIKDFVDTNIKESDKAYKTLEKKAPKMGANKAKYLAAKKEWQSNLDEAKRKADYWKEVHAEQQRITNTTPDQVQEAQDELSGKNAVDELNANKEQVTFTSPLDMATQFVRGAKITPESFQKETGLTTADQGKYVGMISNVGKSIERLGEELATMDDNENGGAFFHGDSNEARSAIIEALGEIRGKGGKKAQDMAEQNATIAAYAQQRDNVFHENYGMGYEDYLAFEERFLPDMLRKYSNFDEDDYNNTYADEIAAQLKQDESYGREPITEGEQPGNDTSVEVLQGSPSDDTGGVAVPGDEGRQVETGSNSDAQDGTVSEEPRGEVNHEAEKFTPSSKKDGEDLFGYAERVIDGHKRKAEEEKVDNNPSEAQKKAGNYKKGHIVVDGFDISIENPKGSVRKGKDKDGNEWETLMHNTYGYIRGTESVDGDHIDIFLSDDPTEGNVYVVDQVKNDGTFDEHKVMYGFADKESAKGAYLSNYSIGWKGLGNITEVSKENFKKWIDSSKRKTKPFAEYSIAKTETPLEEVKQGTEQNGTEKPSSTTKEEKSTDTKVEKNATHPTQEQIEKPKENIEDWGEEIAGARKNAMKELAKATSNITLDDLIQLPLSKVYKKQDFKKMYEDGKISKQDALFLEAVAQLIYAEKKPTGTKSSAKRKAIAWAENVHNILGIINGYAQLETQDHRDVLIEKASNEDGGLNSQIKNVMDVLEGIDYLDQGLGKAKIPLIKLHYDGKSFVVYVNGSSRLFEKTHEDAIKASIRIAKQTRGDNDVEYSKEDFSYTSIRNKSTETGLYYVAYSSDRSVYPSQTASMPKEDAEAKLASLKKKYGEGSAKMYAETVMKAAALKPTITNYAENERYIIEDAPEFETKNELDAYVDENFDFLVEKANEIVSSKLVDKGQQGVKHVKLNIGHERGKAEIIVWKPNERNGYEILAKGFRSYNDAKDWVRKNQEFYDKQEEEKKKKRKEFVFFKPEKERIGTDWRQGKDISEAEFGTTFGFRGVQFGNWTNQKDRQASVNETYDALMDMANILGVSPKALSLNGELGIAFGARGTGRANAHYEVSNIVINLTKTRGTGSLAHEWWHALDNYFSRQGGVTLGFMTDENGKGGMVRKEVEQAYKNLVQAIDNSEYGIRSNILGNYWGSKVEETARLFAEWINHELEKQGKNNSFLSRGIEKGDFEAYRKANYSLYKSNIEYSNKLREEENKSLPEEKKLELIEVVPYEEYIKKQDALDGVPYPTREEIDDLFDKPLKELFNTILEKKGENGKQVLYMWGENPAREEQTKRNEQQAIGNELVDRIQASGIKVHIIGEEIEKVLKDTEGSSEIFKSNNGVIYGFVKDGEIYLDPTLIDANSPVHEYTHLWDSALQKTNPELWNHGKELMSQLPVWNEVLNDENYKDIKDNEDLVASEVHSRLSGAESERLFDEGINDSKKDGVFAEAEARTLIARIKNWLNDVWKWVKDTFTPWTKEEADKVPLKDFINMPIRDLLNGKKMPPVMGEKATIDKNDDIQYLIKEESSTGKPVSIDRVSVRGDYEKQIASGLYQFQEAMQDSMLGLKTLMMDIWKANGKEGHVFDIPGYENPYLLENAMSSANQAQAEIYGKMIIKPLIKAIAAFEGKGYKQEDVTDYMLAKHGLERNDYMRRKTAEEKLSESDYVKEIRKQERYLRTPEGKDDEAAKEELANMKDQFDEMVIETMQGDDHDYSGITSLTKESDVWAAEELARKMVNDFESNAGEEMTNNLWERTNDATKATLRKLYDSGLMTKANYEKVRDMYKNYVPLRGWDETTTEDVYTYMNHRDGAIRGSIMKKAEGRRSKADDPIATIEAMAEAGISQGNRNLMKQAFLNFVQNHPSDLVSVDDIWLKYNDVTEEWETVFPQLSNDDTAEDVRNKVEAFNQRMVELSNENPEKYKRGKDDVNIPYVVVPGTQSEHEILVRRGGRPYVMVINGNPRAAQAVNGLTNPDVEVGGAWGNILKGMEKVNRFISAMVTTRFPDFVASNFVRDAEYSNAMSWVKESPNYAARFGVNFAKNNPAMIGYLLNKFKKGNLDINDETQKMFQDFMMNGGETGYTIVRDIEAHKKKIHEEIRKANGKLPVKRAWQLLGEKFDDVNRSVENCARFNAFLTSRQFGRSVERSIWDAKEVSVNFNKKGAGARFLGTKGMTTLGNTGAFMSGVGRTGFIFWNAGVQGLYNSGGTTLRNPKKALSLMASLFLLGSIIPSLSGDGGDDDKNNYYNLPSAIRRTSICFRVGDVWLSIPLAIEYRALYGLGELATSVMSGNEKHDDKELVAETMKQLTQIMPLDFMEGGGGYGTLVPSSVKPIYESINNEDWTGLPLYKETPYNTNKPDWTKAYKNANKELVDIAKGVSRATGGNDAKKGAVDVNPAEVENILEGYLGGAARTVNMLVKSGETMFANRDFEWRNVPIANRFIKGTDERTQLKAVKDRYYNYLDEFNETKRLEREYKNRADKGVLEYAEELNFLYNSKEYLRMTITEDFVKEIGKLNEQKNNADDDNERKAIESEQNILMTEVVNILQQQEENK